MTLMSQAAYGPTVGAPRILELLARYELKGSFFIPGFTAELHEDLVERIVDTGHELGHHGYLHERPDTLTDEQEEEVLVRGIEALERITGRKPVGYRSPGWELKPSSPALLKRHGFLYDSSLMGNDIPYLVEAADDQLIELPVQWLLDDAPYFHGGSLANPRDVFETWRDEFEGMYEHNCVFVLTCHPFISGRPSRVLLLERLIRHIRSFPGVWFATLEEIARYCADNDVCSVQKLPAKLLTPGQVS
jgi:peptidoglycan/xylan/chitin deacetylase (PgdA/CDA1 family)